MLADQQRFYLELNAHFIPTPAKYKKEAPFLTEADNQALNSIRLVLDQMDSANPDVETLRRLDFIFPPEFASNKTVYAPK